MPKRPEINIQDSLLFQWLRDKEKLTIELITGKVLAGTLIRFDRFCLLVETDGKPLLIYKHALSRIAATPS
ncbi:MAG: RNA chaperone Hfq [Acidobacteriota bacterium]